LEQELEELAAEDQKLAEEELRLTVLESDLNDRLEVLAAEQARAKAELKSFESASADD
jgi:hypothetical protein